MIVLEELLKTTGGAFFTFLLPKIKNSKFFRDIKDKWIRDNYAERTTSMFQAAVQDAQAALNLPDNLVVEVLDDSINRNEVFSWILKGIPEKLDQDKLNLDPYLETYHQYEDLIRPFFELIALNLQDYKEKHWEPEFLELLNKVDTLIELTEEEFNKINEKYTNLEQLSKVNIELSSESNRYLKEVITPVQFNDLNELIRNGKLLTAREKALERRNKPNIKRNEILELNIVIANSYIESREYQKAIPYLYTALTFCEEEPRKHRIRAIINIFENNFEEANKNINEAIELEGKTNNNIEILINILIGQKKFDDAINLIDSESVNKHEELKATIFLSSKDYKKVLEIADRKVEENPDNIDWLLFKVEATILKLENDINNNKITFPEQIFEEIMPILEKIESRIFENTGILNRVKELKATLFCRCHKYSEAKLLFEELFLKERDYSGHFYKNLILNCLFDKDWKKAIKFIEEKDNILGLEKEEVLTLADVYIRTGKADDAVALLRKNREQFTVNGSPSYRYYLSYIDSLFSSLRHIEIEKLIKEVEVEGDIVKGNIMKGYLAYKKQDWENVIKFFEAILNKLDELDLIEIKGFLSQAYFNKGSNENYRKLKEVILTIPNWFYHDFLVQRYIYALYHLGEYENIFNLYKKLPFQTHFILEVLTTIYFNLGWYDIAKENYRSLYQQTSNIEYLIRYANCLYHLGYIKECLDILASAETRVLQSGKFEDYQLLSLAYLNAKEYRKSMEYAYLTFEAGKDHPEVWKFYFMHISQVSQFVNNPDSKWIEEYQNIFKDFEEKFPNEDPIIKKVEVIKDGNIAEDFIKEIKRADISSIVYSIINEQKLPLSFIISVLKRDPFKTWEYIVRGKDYYLWISNGSIKEVDNGSHIAKTSKNILLDFTTLLTLHHLDLLEFLTDKYKVYIHQEQFDTALQEYTQSKVISEQGTKYLSYKDGRIIVSEYTSEQVKESLKKQEHVIEWINKNCTKVGNMLTNNFGMENQYNNISFLNNPLEICKKKSLTMLVDSVFIREYALKNFDVKCFTTLDLINTLLTENKIDKEKHCDLFGKLMIMGYVLLPISKDVFIHYLKENNYKINTEIQLLLNYLKIHFFNENYLINLVAEILSWIWTEEIPLSDRRIITDELCAALCFNRSNTVIIPRLISLSKTKFHFLVAHQWNKMKDCIEEWLEVRILN